MTKRWTMALGMTVLAGVAAAQEATPPLGSPKDKLSYALGIDLGKQFKKTAVDVDPAVFARGLKDALSGGPALLTDEEVRAAVAGLREELRSRQVAAVRTRAEGNKKEGEAFLAANATKEGVVTLPSGLQYKVLKAGDGRKPTEADTVEVHYRGTLLDGTEFDSSYKRGQPQSMAVKGLVKGWIEALPLMPVGSKWQLFVPPPLAYGERGAGRNIGPNATLVFEIELVAIK
jgi:FKBP-type peptidyl-prolyl cis-trans isomerase FklB